MTPPDKSSTESRMHTLLADFQKSIETSDRARVSAEPTVSSQKILRSILKNRERTSPRRDRPEDRPLKRVRFEPASGGPLKESVPSGAHAPEKFIASWSVSFFVAPPQHQHPCPLANLLRRPSRRKRCFSHHEGSLQTRQLVGGRTDTYKQ
jgi:hypothetical protein